MKTRLVDKYFATLLSLGEVGCLPPSSDVVVGRVHSTEYVATLSKRNSGAMSKGSTLVSVRLNGVPDDTTHGLIVLGITGDRLIEMKWTSPHDLALSCPLCSAQDVNFEAVRTGTVTISYSYGLSVR